MPGSSAAAAASPSIGGIPEASVTAGTEYSFQPTSSDPNGDELSYAITNKPVWATFSATSGLISGTPSVAQVGSYSGIVISVNAGGVGSSLPAFSINVIAPAITPPTISGTPPTTVIAGATYSFAPTFGDTGGGSLMLSIQNMPAWTTFNTSTGLLTGTPAVGDVGTFSDIIISVSDGPLNISLPAFSITVNPATGPATLTWSAPTLNTDGTTLSDLSGFNIYYGTSPTSLTQKVSVSSPSTTSYTLSSVPAGVLYFALTAIDSAGDESALSNTGAVVIL